MFPNKFSQLKQCHYSKTAQEIQCNQMNLTNKCWQKKKKKKGYLRTHNSLMDLKLMQNEVNTTLNVGGTLGLVPLDNSTQIFFVD